MSKEAVSLDRLQDLVSAHIPQNSACEGMGDVVIRGLADSANINWRIQSIGIGHAHAHALSIAASWAQVILGEQYDLVQLA